MLTPGKARTKSVLLPMFWTLVGAGIATGISSLRQHDIAEKASVATVHPQLWPIAASTQKQIFEVPISTDSFEHRIEIIADSNPVSKAQKAAIIVDWLARDRQSALRYLAANRFRDARLPGVAEAIGSKASGAELVLIANESESPNVVLDAVGRFVPLAVINEFSGMMSEISPGSVSETVSAVSALLAGANLDRGVNFALSQPTNALQNSALIGVFDQLRDQPNASGETLSLFKSLPPSLQSSNAVLFYYSQAIAASDPQAALTALAEITDPNMKVVAAIQLAKNTANTTPETAIAALYDSGMSQGAIQQKVGTILQNWYTVDPQAASGFLSSTQIISPSDKQGFQSIIPPANSGKG